MGRLERRSRRPYSGQMRQGLLGYVPLKRSLERTNTPRKATPSVSFSLQHTGLPRRQGFHTVACRMQIASSAAKRPCNTARYHDLIRPPKRVLTPLKSTSSARGIGDFGVRVCSSATQRFVPIRASLNRRFRGLVEMLTGCITHIFFQACRRRAPSG